jgi:hypothetical protein
MKIILAVVLCALFAGCGGCGPGTPEWQVKTLVDKDGNFYVASANSGYCNFSIVQLPR